MCAGCCSTGGSRHQLRRKGRPHGGARVRACWRHPHEACGALAPRQRQQLVQPLTELGRLHVVGVPARHREEGRAGAGAGATWGPAPAAQHSISAQALPGFGHSLRPALPCRPRQRPAWGEPRSRLGTPPSTRPTPGSLRCPSRRSSRQAPCCACAARPVPCPATRSGRRPAGQTAGRPGRRC